MYALGDHFKFCKQILCYEINLNNHCRRLGFFVLLKQEDFLKPVESRLELFNHLFFSQLFIFSFKIAYIYFGI